VDLGELTVLPRLCSWIFWGERVLLLREGKRGQKGERVSTEEGRKTKKGREGMKWGKEKEGRGGPSIHICGYATGHL